MEKPKLKLHTNKNFEEYPTKYKENFFYRSVDWLWENPLKGIVLPLAFYTTFMLYGGYQGTYNPKDLILGDTPRAEFKDNYETQFRLTVDCFDTNRNNELDTEESLNMYEFSGKPIRSDSVDNRVIFEIPKLNMNDLIRAEQRCETELY